VKTVTIDLKPPGLLERAWHRRLGIEPAAFIGHTGPRSALLARLAPYSWRWFHRAYAWLHDYFWLPCPLCGRAFGGHEAGVSIPNPLKGPGSGIAVCSQCTRTGPGREYW
jgi:hypothetical protein